MKEETRKHLLAQIQENFKTFGGGQEVDHINKTALALQDGPLCFAAGVDVAEVVEVVLRDYNSYEQDQETIKALVEALGAMIGMYHGVFGCVNSHIDSQGRAIRCCVCGTVEDAEAALALAKKE